MGPDGGGRPPPAQSAGDGPPRLGQLGGRPRRAGRLAHTHGGPPRPAARHGTHRRPTGGPDQRAEGESNPRTGSSRAQGAKGESHLHTTAQSALVNVPGPTSDRPWRHGVVPCPCMGDVSIARCRTIVCPLGEGWGRPVFLEEGRVRYRRTCLMWLVTGPSR